MRRGATTDPCVSVILATYNRARLVTEAIDSVLGQTFVDWELIIIDDGSTDDTAAVLARYTDPRIHTWRQSNQGISRARNTGLARARGEYVIMLDSDDRQLPQCLATLVAAAEARPNAVVVYGRSRGMDDAGSPIPRVVGAPEPFAGQTLRSLLYGDFVSLIAALIRRSALVDVGGFDPATDFAEDWDLWIRLARRGPFVYVETVLAEVRLHTGRSTNAQRQTLDRLVAVRVGILDRAFADPNLPDEARSVRPLAYRNIHIDAGLRYLKVGETRQAAAHFRQALRHGAPVATAARIVYLAAFLRLAPRYGWANRLSDAVAARRRATHAARSEG